MRTIALFIITMVAGVSCIGPETAKALPLSAVAVADPQSKSAVEEVGWRRRWYRGYVYPAPYAYYPPAYTYYPPPPPAYYAPAYPAYPYYRPYGYYRPYYAPY
jgi:hypothetical protein